MKIDKSSPTSSVVPVPIEFDPEPLHRELDMHNHALRQQIFKLFQDHDEIFRVRYGESLKRERERTNERWAVLHQAGLYKNTVTKRDLEAIMRYDTVVECLSMLDHSLEVKTGVHYGLFGSSIARLGTDEQASRYLPLVENLEMLGCFGLTELGHGSNVRGIETTATYDKAKDMFVIHTPTKTAQKYWIGGAAETVRWCAVFANLLVNHKNHGIHAFLIRLRTDEGRLMPGVDIRDVGHKCGLNGVDNGMIWFDHVEIPRENMLSRYAWFDAEGNYRSSIENDDERFAVQLGALTGGRVSIAVGAINQTKIGLATAINYAWSRCAFGPSDSQQEVPLIFYKSHQYRLIPYLASTIVMAFCANQLKKQWWQCASSGKMVTRNVHVLSSGFKAIMTWQMRDCMQSCREACGGQGYLSENRIGPVKNDHDVQMTFEGDNSVLLQRTGKMVFEDFKRWAKMRSAATKLADAARENLPGCLEFVDSLGLNGERGSLRIECKAAMIAFVRGALTERLVLVLQLLRSKVDEQTGQGVDPFYIWNNCSMIASDVALAYTDLVLWSMYSKELVRMRAESHLCSVAVETLEDCALLYGVQQILTNPQFVTMDCVTKKEVALLEEYKDKVCTSLTPKTKSLVASFGIPKNLLGPIAGDWVTFNGRTPSKL